MQCKLNSGHNHRVTAQVEGGAEKYPKHKRNVALEHGRWIKKVKNTKPNSVS